MIPPGHLLGREALGGEDGLEGLRPGLVLDLGVDLALHVLAEDDGAAAEGGEAGDHVGDAGAVPGDGDPRLVGPGQQSGAAGAPRASGARAGALGTAGAVGGRRRPSAACRQAPVVGRPGLERLAPSRSSPGWRRRTRSTL